MTLKFFGQAGESSVAELSKEMAELSASLPPVATGFRGLCLFPNPKNPRVLAVGLSPGDGLRFLFDGVCEASARSGFGRRGGRKFVPHVTIGRARAGFEGIADIGGPDELEFFIRRVGLVRSELGPGGSRYFEEGSWALRGTI